MINCNFLHFDIDATSTCPIPIHCGLGKFRNCTSIVVSVVNLGGRSVW